MTKTFYAIYDTEKKVFKGRGNSDGVRWVEFPTQTYDTENRARAALKAHLKRYRSYPYSRYDQHNEVFIKVIPITVSW